VPVNAPDSMPTVVRMTTSAGEILIGLYTEDCPETTGNFLKLVDDGFYNGLHFHRVIKGFMIQGGGFTQEMMRKETNAPIKNEATNGVGNERGTLAMARTGEVDSATAQFFINTVNNRALNNRGTDPAQYGYAVFGKVTDGMNVVDQIENAATGTSGPYRDVPSTPIVINAIRLQ